MAIFIVEVTFAVQVPVEAPTAEAAEDAAYNYALNEIDNNGVPAASSASASEIKRASGHWGQCLPWGGDGERTIAQILAQPEAAPTEGLCEGTKP